VSGLYETDLDEAVWAVGAQEAILVGYPWTADRKAGYRLLGGLGFALPDIRIVIADAGHESRKLARELRRHDGYELRIVKR